MTADSLSQIELYTACGQKKNVSTDDVSEKEMANIQETAAQEVTAQEIITQEITIEKEPEDDG